MNAFANSKDEFIDLSKLGFEEMKLLREFYNFLLFKKVKKSEDKNEMKKLPDVFYHPTKVDNYLAFERSEIYGDE
ncbi:MAG: hypothetical protein K9H16_15045 [Bacteroidales bacterium]|nr:hypothetical protein [Bacteroidales bacterium]